MEIHKPYALLSRQKKRQFQTHLQVCFNTIKDLFKSSPVLALDYETQGLHAHNPQLCAVGMGLSNADNAVYVDLINCDFKDDLYKWLETKQLVAHNVVFDAGWYYRDTGTFGNWIGCTSAMFKYLSTEGWLGQTWSLKTAMVDILGWDEPNNVELKQWLKEHKLGLGDMWKAPAEILGKYCAMDAAATFHLYEYFWSFKSKFPRLFEYHDNEFMALAKLTLVQQLRGMAVDVERLKKYRDTLYSKTLVLESDFFKVPEVRPIVEEYNKEFVAAHKSKKPEMMTKTGKVSVRYEKWASKLVELQATNHFNINSKLQLRWLFYQKLGYQPVKQTKSGESAVDKTVLPLLGEGGMILAEHSKVNKELQYVDACLELSKTGTLHPMMRVPSTISGRCAGGIDG